MMSGQANRQRFNRSSGRPVGGPLGRTPLRAPALAHGSGCRWPHPKSATTRPCRWDLAGRGRSGPDGPAGHCTRALGPEPMQGPQRPQRPSRCNGLRGQGLSPGPELWGLHPPRGPRRSKGVDIETEVRAPRPAPALARAQWSRRDAGPMPHARAALRPRFALAVPSPPLPCPRHAAPHIPSTPPASRARGLGPRARWRRIRQLPRR